MGRQKIARECSFKPDFTLFEPVNRKIEGELELNADEMEALYLMDYEGLYQEDAAHEMGVSRPTFSRIIKSARTKTATALVRGYRLQIVDAKDKFVVALVVEREGDFSNYAITSPLIVLVHLFNQKVINVESFQNPAQNQKPSVALPPFLKSHGVSYLLGDKIGEGLKNSLLARGVFFKQIPPLKSLDEIPAHICKPL